MYSEKNLKTKYNRDNPCPDMNWAVNNYLRQFFAAENVNKDGSNRVESGNRR